MTNLSTNLNKNRVNLMSQNKPEITTIMYITQQIKSSQQNLPSTYDKTDYPNKHK